MGYWPCPTRTRNGDLWWFHLMALQIGLTHGSDSLPTQLSCNFQESLLPELAVDHHYLARISVCPYAVLLCGLQRKAYSSETGAASPYEITIFVRAQGMRS